MIDRTNKLYGAASQRYRNIDTDVVNWINAMETLAAPEILGAGLLVRANPWVIAMP